MAPWELRGFPAHPGCRGSRYKKGWAEQSLLAFRGSISPDSRLRLPFRMSAVGKATSATFLSGCACPNSRWRRQARASESHSQLQGPLQWQRADLVLLLGEDRRREGVEIRTVFVPRAIIPIPEAQNTRLPRFDAYVKLSENLGTPTVSGCIGILPSRTHGKGMACNVHWFCRHPAWEERRPCGESYDHLGV